MILGQSVIGVQPLGAVIVTEGVVGKRASYQLMLTQKSTFQAQKRLALVQDVQAGQRLAAHRLVLSQAVAMRVLPELELSQEVLAAKSGKALPFAHSWRKQRWSLRVQIGRNPVNLCSLFETATIQGGENEATVCSLVLKPFSERDVEIDLYQYSNLDLTIDADFEGGQTVRVFTGLIDSLSADDLISGQKMTITATDARERKLNQQPRSWVQNIGYFSDLVFKKPEEYETQSDEVADRLSTVAASVEWFEGRPFITPLRPNHVADFVMTDCDVFNSSPPRLGLTSSERHVNVAELTLQIQSHIAYQREMNFHFDSGYTICDYFTHGRPPSVDAIRQAATGAGWVITDFKTEKMKSNQWARCQYMSQENYWAGSKDEYINEAGRRQVDNYEEAHAQQAWWKAAKRWMQPVEEKYTIRLQNTGSIRRFGEQKRQYTLSLSNDLERLKDDANAKEILDWENWTQYEKPSKDFQQIQNGYARWLNRIEAGTDGAIQCMMAQMAVDILKSHRDTCTIETRFAPEIDLRHTVKVNMKRLQVHAKVSAFTHTIDFAAATGRSEFELAYFANGSGSDQGFAVPRLPNRGLPKFYEQAPSLKKLGTVRKPLGAKVVANEEEAASLPRFYFGVLYFEYKSEGNIVEEYFNYSRPGIKLYRFKEFIVKTPEIEEESTMTMEVTLPVQTREVGIFDNEVRVML